MRRRKALLSLALAGVLSVSAFSPALAAGRRTEEFFISAFGSRSNDWEPRSRFQQENQGADRVRGERADRIRGERGVDSAFIRQVVSFRTDDAPGSIVVDTGRHFLYLVLGDGKAMRYGIGVAKDGFEWSGTHKVSRKREWPDWTPPAEMLKRRPDLPRHMEGGIDNPLGARALYLGSTLYRIHGTNEPWSIGQNVSSGCIRMTNDDVVDLYGRVKIGARVVVL